MGARVTHELGRMDKDGREQIRARVVEINGVPHVDLRTAYVDTERHIVETDHGITFPLDRLPAFVRLVGRFRGV